MLWFSSARCAPVFSQRPTLFSSDAHKITFVWKFFKKEPYIGLFCSQGWITFNDFLLHFHAGFIQNPEGQTAKLP